MSIGASYDFIQVVHDDIELSENQSSKTRRCV